MPFVVDLKLVWRDVEQQNRGRWVTDIARERCGAVVRRKTNFVEHGAGAQNRAHY
jgi:hypothetical protein